MSVEEILMKNSLTKCADIFGVSEPTISRWKSERKYPKFAEVIAKLREEIKTYDNITQKLVIKNRNLTESLDNIKNFFRELIIE